MRNWFQVSGYRLIFLWFLFLPGILVSQVIPGVRRIDVYQPLLKDTKIGVVSNVASVDAGKNTVDYLICNGFLVKKVFCPEHGFRSGFEAGALIQNSTDSVSGLPVISLYGEHKKPFPEDMADLDYMVFDLQDVGVRFYTYISTLTYVMEACAENHIPLVVFDRPNPNGFYIDGPVLEKNFSSFVGLHPVPIVYGMTMGEYARMVNGEGWLKNKVRCDLIIIPLMNYTHHTLIQGLVKPSPNLTTMNAIWLYPSLCLFEGTIISVGRGTDTPFEIFGHPDLKTDSFIFVPKSIPGMSLHPPFENQKCFGTNLQGVMDSDRKRSGKIQLSWLINTYKEMNKPSGFFTVYFDKLAGNSTLREQIIKGKTEDDIRKSWQSGINKFKEIRKNYLLYPE
ncbi:MAG: DUF1343 domain-containing protein [Bacteroidales bacterium]|nr:DUF1343 domain-containing protein [Bacteroidales bacterium]